MSKVALVQRPPVYLDRAATLERVVAAVAEAAAAGARLVVFPEAYVAGYPAWIWRLRPYPDAKLFQTLHDRLVASAVDLSTDVLAPVREAARAAGAVVVLGMNEVDGEYSRGTVYNSVVIIDERGEVANRHRKLIPTNPERMVWGLGDASGLRTVPTAVGRVGTLICWESYMPLARFAVYAQGVELYVAPTWDSGEGWRASMQHIAREGRCWVLGCAAALQVSDLPDDFPGRDVMFPDAGEWIHPGDSLVVDPLGKVVAGPMAREKGIVYAECDRAAVAAAHRTLDVAGHYGRPDIFRLEVDRTPQAPITFKR